MSSSLKCLNCRSIFGNPSMDNKLQIYWHYLTDDETVWAQIGREGNLSESSVFVDYTSTVDRMPWLLLGLSQINASILQTTCDWIFSRFECFDSLINKKNINRVPSRLSLNSDAVTVAHWCALLCYHCNLCNHSIDCFRLQSAFNSSN